jgi:hypothetical protein
MHHAVSSHSATWCRTLPFDAAMTLLGGLGDVAYLRKLAVGCPQQAVVGSTDNLFARILYTLLNSHVSA